MDKLGSEAMHSLNARQRDLFLHMMLEYNGNSGKKGGDPFSFDFGWQKACGEHELYTNKRTFYGDVRALIDSGLIDRTERQDEDGVRSVYRFSERWKNAGGVCLPEW